MTGGPSRAICSAEDTGDGGASSGIVGGRGDTGVGGIGLLGADDRALRDWVSLELTVTASSSISDEPARLKSLPIDDPPSNESES